MSVPDQLEYIILDACCLINLYATGRIADVLEGLPARFALAEYVASREALFILGDPTAEEAEPRVSIDLAPVVSVGLLEIVDLETEDEITHFVQFAAHLDDGEAMTCALAISRGATVATDDRKALNRLRTLAPGVPTRTTLSLVKWWSETIPIADDALHEVLMRIRRRARFEPGKHDLLRAWWYALLGQ